MTKCVWLLGCAALLLGACDDVGGASTEKPADGFIHDLPEGVLAIAAPYQDLTAVRMDPAGCYIYRYKGPVETTFLPLRSTEGRPICTRVAATGTDTTV